MAYKTMMSMSEVKRYGEIIDYYGYFSWKVLSEGVGALIIIGIWLTLFLIFLSMLTKRGRMAYIASSAASGGYSYGTGVVTVAIITWFAGCFAWPMIFSGFFGYHLHCWFSTESVSAAEQFFVRAFAMIGWLEW